MLEKRRREIMKGFLRLLTYKECIMRKNINGNIKNINIQKEIKVHRVKLHTRMRKMCYNLIMLLM